MTSKDPEVTNDDLDKAENIEHVVHQCLAGASGARRQLYDLCQHRVYRLMVRMVGLQDAADVSQQVFVQLFRKIDGFRGHAKFETWLYRLAVNEALQHLRKAKRWQFQPLAHEPMSEPETSFGEEKELLERALSQIDSQLRCIFLLREVEGLSYQQIAETLDVPAGTVGSRLNRARRELQMQLKLLGWEP